MHFSEFGVLEFQVTGGYMGFGWGFWVRVSKVKRRTDCRAVLGVVRRMLS